jgi:hypothetical protein
MRPIRIVPKAEALSVVTNATSNPGVAHRLTCLGAPIIPSQTGLLPEQKRHTAVNGGPSSWKLGFEHIVIHVGDKMAILGESLVTTAWRVLGLRMERSCEYIE